MLFIILTIIFFITTISTSILFYLKNKECIFHKRALDEIRYERDKVEDKIYKIKEDMKSITKIGVVSDKLIYINKKEDLLNQLIITFRDVIEVHQIVIYDFDEKASSYNKIMTQNIMHNLPDTVPLNNMKITGTRNSKEYSNIVRTAGGAPLYFVKLIGKKPTIPSLSEFDDFSEMDLNTIDIFLNQSAMVLDKINAYTKMEKMALTDNLTGLYNRHFAYMMMKKEAKRASRYNYPISILFMDIDKFKSVNDTYGHDVGDLAIQYIANTLIKYTRESDICVRWGGEEFVVLLPNTNEAGAFFLAEKLRQAVIDDKFEHCPLTISLGISCYPNDSVSIDEVLSHADSALYYSKQTGRNKSSIYREIKDVIK